ncbi:MAG: lasso peptide biosynthesis B2 protein [Pseudoxanthomonas sp.]
MGRVLQRWRELDAHDRLRLGGCVLGLWCVHAGLALFGYQRTRRMIERASTQTSTRAATTAELTDAQSLARLAASAGRNAMGEQTCLRRSLLLYGWLRRRGLQPALQFGVPRQQAGTGFEAHAWIELDGIRLLPGDEGYLPFGAAMP